MREDEDEEEGRREKRKLGGRRGKWMKGGKWGRGRRVEEDKGE